MSRLFWRAGLIAVSPKPSPRSRVGLQECAVAFVAEHAADLVHTKAVEIVDPAMLASKPAARAFSGMQVKPSSLSSVLPFYRYPSSQKIINLDSGWRLKFSNYRCHSGVHGFCAREVDVMESQIVPQRIGQGEVIAKNIFSSRIVQNQTLGDMFEAAGGSKLGTISVR